MKLEDAIAAHAEWKLRLCAYVDGTSREVLVAATVCRDDQCALGKWMHGDGRRLTSVAEFVAARTAHAEFHRHAGAVVQTVDGGDRARATAMLAPDGAFEKASMNVASSLVRLRRAMQARAA